MSNTEKFDSSAYSEAAEDYVRCLLTFEHLEVWKAPPGRHGFDLKVYGTNGKSALVQVKSRYQTDHDGFMFGGTTSDFVVFVALNREYRHPNRRGPGRPGRKAPEIWIVPGEVANKHWKVTADKWEKLLPKDVPNWEDYRDAWHLITNHVGDPESTVASYAVEWDDEGTTMRLPYDVLRKAKEVARRRSAKDTELYYVLALNHAGKALGQLTFYQGRPGRIEGVLE